MIPGYFLI